MRLRAQGSLFVRSSLLPSLLALFLAFVLTGFGGCKSEVTLVAGIPVDAAAEDGGDADPDEGGPDDSGVGDDAAPDGTGDDGGADGDNLDCGAVDTDGGTGCSTD